MLGAGGISTRTRTARRTLTTALLLSAAVIVPSVVAQAQEPPGETTTTTATTPPPSTESTTTATATAAEPTATTADTAPATSADAEPLAATSDAATVTLAAAPGCAMAQSVYPGEASANADCLETRLAALGFAVDGPDGVFNGVSISSLQAFQSRYGIPVTTIATPLTLAYLSLWNGPSLFGSCTVAYPVAPNDLSEDARCLEMRLAASGYDIGGPDQWFGGHSVLTLQAIQRGWGLAATGVATPLTLWYLGIWGGDPQLLQPCSVNTSVRPGEWSPSSPCVERRLAQLGYNTSGVDGWYGGQSADSMRAFQTTWGLPADGIATPLTLAYLSIWAGDRFFDPCAVWTSIVPGSVTSSTVCLERKLAQMGYDVVGPDWSFDDVSAASYRHLQNRVGVSADGLAGKYMLTYLGIWTQPTPLPCGLAADVGWGSSGGVVFCVEQRLIDLGYSMIGPDGTFDAWTELAVATYQSASGLPRSGRVDPTTAYRLGIWHGPDPNPHGLPDNSGTGRRVVYDRSQQRVWAVEADGTVVKTHRVSGRTREPYAGTYSVYSRSMYTYSAADPTIKWRYMVRFAYGPGGGRIGFHEIPTRHGVPLQSERQLGQPLSGGCVRQSTADAEWMWNWAGVGTKVVVL